MGRTLAVAVAHDFACVLHQLLSLPPAHAGQERAHAKFIADAVLAIGTSTKLDATDSGIHGQAICDMRYIVLASSLRLLSAVQANLFVTLAFCFECRVPGISYTGALAPSAAQKKMEKNTVNFLLPSTLS